MVVAFEQFGEERRVGAIVLQRCREGGDPPPVWEWKESVGYFSFTPWPGRNGWWLDYASRGDGDRDCSDECAGSLSDAVRLACRIEGDVIATLDEDERFRRLSRETIDTIDRMDWDEQEAESREAEREHWA